MFAVAIGVLISKPVAWCLAILATAVLFMVVASYERVQRHLPDLGRLPLVRDYGFYRHPTRSTPPQTNQSTPPDKGWIAPDQLGAYLASINQTMELHGFGRNPPSPQVVENVTPASIEQELIVFVPVAGRMLHGEVTQSDVDGWASSVGVGIRARGPTGEEEMFLAEGHHLDPAEELRAKVDRLQNHILPKVRAGEWTR